MAMVTVGPDLRADERSEVARDVDAIGALGQSLRQRSCRRVVDLPGRGLQQTGGPRRGIGAREGRKALDGAKPAGSPSSPGQSCQTLTRKARERKASGHDVCLIGITNTRRLPEIEV